MVSNPGSAPPSQIIKTTQTVEQKAHKDHEVGPLAAIELADEVGAEEGDGVGQDADCDGKDERGATGGLEFEQFDEAADAEDVEHGQGAEEDTRKHQEHPLASSVEVGLLHGVQLTAIGCHPEEDSGSQNPEDSLLNSQFLILNSAHPPAEQKEMEERWY